MSKQSLRYAAAKAPEITLLFWGMKLLTTGMGEAMSDYLGGKSVPIGGGIGVLAFCLAFYLQLKQDRYRAPYYWFMVAMVAVVGTMFADATHDGLGVTYWDTTIAFGLLAAAVFTYWGRSEGTLDIHTITTRRREVLYWVAIFWTFAFGTAAGDLTATQLKLGYPASIVLFCVIMLIPVLGWWKFRMNSLFAFWFAYINTRPIGASFADFFSKRASGGLGLHDGPVAGVALIVFVALVSYKTISRHGIQDDQRVSEQRLHGERRLAAELE